MFSDMTKRDGLVLTAIVAVGIALRVPGLYHDFWLDEIWSLVLVAPLTSPGQVFTDVHFDLNHWLHSLLLLAIGDHPYWPVYRLPAFAAACASLVVVATWPTIGSRAERVVATVLFAASFALVVYSTEARGYAWLILFALLSYRTLLGYERSGRLPVAGLFWVFAVLGFLSQVTFVFVYAALGLWSAGMFYAGTKRWGRVARDLVVFYGVPAVFFFWLYVIDIRFVEHGGAGEGTVFAAVVEFAGWLMGTPSSGWAGGVAIGLLILLVVYAGWTMCRSGDPGWLLYAGLIVVPVAVALTTSREGFSHWKPRHFIGVAPFFLLLAARGLATMWLRGGRWRLLCGVLVAVFLVGNAVRSGRFIALGRGHYMDAMRYMASRSPDGVIEVGADHDFRNLMVIAFYAQYLPDHEVRFVPRDRWEGAGPAWFFVHAQGIGHEPEAELSNPNSGRRFTLEAEFPYSGVSGWNWYLYRNANMDE